MTDPAWSADGSYWHCTTADRLEKITSQGLRPQRRRRWNNAFGAALGERDRIYLISDFREAVRWGAKMAYDHSATVVLLKMLPDVAPEPDECFESQLAGRTWFKAPALAPSCVLRTLPLTPELVRAIVSSNYGGPGVTEPPLEISPSPGI